MPRTPSSLHLPTTQKEHQILSLSQNVPLLSWLPLSTHTHLGGSKVTERRLSPQHLAQDGTTPLQVREPFLRLCPQGPEPAPRTETQGWNKHNVNVPPSTLVCHLGPLAVYSVSKSSHNDLESTYSTPCWAPRRAVLDGAGADGRTEAWQDGDTEQ